MSGKRRRVEPTDDWEQLGLLCGWPEQRGYELIRPIVLFGIPATERARETNAASARTLQRRAARFDEEGVESLFDAEPAKHRKLPPSLRRLVTDLKAEHPPLSLGEIARICWVRSGRRPSKHTVKRVLREEPWPLRMVRRFEPYHEIPEPRERRLAVVQLHAEGWAVKSIASYLEVSRQTVYGVLRRWLVEGEAGLEDRKRGRREGVRKVTLKAILTVRELQKNPALGEFRVHAALKQLGIRLSPRAVGRILATTAPSTGSRSPRRGPGARRRCPSGQAGATSSGRRTCAT